MKSSGPVCSSVIFSDYVIREQGSNKLSLIGCFQGFNAPRFPFQAPPFFITVAITNLHSVPKELNVTAKIKATGNGGVLATCNAQLRPPQPSAAINPKTCVEIPMPFQSLVFNAAGEYEVIVTVADEEAGRRFLLVNSAPVPAS